VVRVALTALALLCVSACSQQVGDVAEATRAREVNREVSRALSHAPDETEVRGVGCRYEDCVTVRGTDVLEKADVVETCRDVHDTWSALGVEVVLSESLENGCRLIGRYDDHELGASVQERDDGVTLSLRTTALGTSR
jgi:hypothetical protein